MSRRFQKIYWRPHRVSGIELVFVAVAAVAGALSVEQFRVTERQPHFEQKVAAARLARTAMETVSAERQRLGHEVDLEVDPTGSGMLGVLISPVTSNAGNLSSKQTSVNPNFAALVVDYLRRLKLERGATVAVGASGSFPALNVAVYAALETLGLEPVIISSASASQFGANLPDLLWIDMERVLAERGVFSHRSVAASRGGIDDRGVGISDVGLAKLDAAIRTNGLEIVDALTLHDSIERRMAIYRAHSGGQRYAAYINIGGGSASVGTHVGKKLYASGINKRPPTGAGAVDSVMNRLAFDGVPIIHLTRIKTLAQRYGFPIEPETMPPIGQGRIYERLVYNKWLAGAVGGVLLLLLTGVVRTDWGFRLMQMSGLGRGRKPPEQMV